MRGWFACLLILGTGCANSPSQAGARDDAVPTLRVTTFNIRHSRAKDGPNAWPLRRELFFDALKRADADLLGLQEVLADQAAEIRAALPGYGFVGVGRNDGKAEGEFVPILFRTDRFELIDSGHYWLSPTPDEIGSKGWDANLPRIITWAKLRDRRAGGQTFVLINTHWDHLGKMARAESATLMRRRIVEFAGELPVIITGDFNCTEDDPPYATLVRDDAAPRLIDAFRVAHPERSPDESTFGGYKGNRAGSRIDWILHTPHLRTVAASIDRFSVDGRYPSDHYPVHAELAWSSKAAN